MILSGGDGGGGGRPGEKGAGGVREAGEKGAGGVREAGEKGAGSGIPKVAGSGRKREKITQHCAIFRNRKNANEREPKNTGREPGLKGTGSGRFKPPCPPSPPSQGQSNARSCRPGRHEWLSGAPNSSFRGISVRKA